MSGIEEAPYPMILEILRSLWIYCDVVHLAVLNLVFLVLILWNWCPPGGANHRADDDAEIVHHNYYTDDDDSIAMGTHG